MIKIIIKIIRESLDPITTITGIAKIILVIQKTLNLFKLKKK